MPDPTLMLMRPSTSSAMSASRTLGLDTDMASARSRSDGSRLPTGNSPELIRPRICSAICR
jgi:hypothetical protein